MRWIAALSAASVSLVATLAHAQDSVSISGCLPGDAVEPWTDVFSGGLNGPEQQNAYVVDLAPITGSWGTAYGIGPIAKSGKSNAFLFFSSLMGGNGISRDMKTGARFSAPEYMFWNQPGFGVNGDPTLNNAGTDLDASSCRGVQFATVFQEGGNTSTGAAYAGVVTSVVNIDPSDPGRLYVNRIQTATNSCDATSDLAAIGLGSVDADGNTVFRADGFGVQFGGCSVNPIPPGSPNNNIFLVEALERNAAFLNVISDDAASLDPGTTTRLVNNANDVHTVPSIYPASLRGGEAMYLGVDFPGNFVRGTPSGGPVTSDMTHLPPTNGTRGNPAFLGKPFAPLGAGQEAMLAILGEGTNGTNLLHVWGINAAGTPTGDITPALPAAVVDNSDGFTNVAGINEFDNYHSQVAFQGGNGCVGLNIDPAGNLILAAMVDHPDDGPDNQWGGNYIAVCKVDPAGNASWTMAGYIDPVTTNGKPIYTGDPNAGGVVTHQMKQLVLGPSVSSPMVDPAGNVYFLSFIEELGNLDTSVALLKAVYDPVGFAYDLEIVVKTGDVLPGQNSGRDYLITSLRLTDSNSIASDAPFSQNIVQDGFLGYDVSNFANTDSRTMGGITVAANVIYDVDQDGTFDGDDCATTGSIDEEYRVLLYIGSLGESGVETHGDGCVGTNGLIPGISWSGFPTSGEEITLAIDNALGGQSALLFISAFGQASIPVNPACSLNINPVPSLVGPIVLPLLGVGPGNGEISVTLPLPALPPGLALSMQAFCTDPGVGLGASATKGLTVTIQ